MVMHMLVATEVWCTEAWPAEVWPTEVWPTEVWPIEVWPTELWPIEVWPTEVWPTRVWPTEVWPIEHYPSPSLTDHFQALSTLLTLKNKHDWWPYKMLTTHWRMNHTVHGLMHTNLHLWGYCTVSMLLFNRALQLLLHIQPTVHSVTGGWTCHNHQKKKKMSLLFPWNLFYHQCMIFLQSFLQPQITLVKFYNNFIYSWKC